MKNNKKEILSCKGALLAGLIALALPTFLFADVSEDPEKDGEGSGKKPSGTAPFITPPPVDGESLREGVQITELGCMRLLLVLSPDATDVDKLVKQRFTDVHFRVFPSPVKLEEDELSPAEMHKMGNDRYADFVVHVQTTSRLKNKLGKSELYEAEATVTAYSPLSEEILAVQTSREIGERKVDSLEAKRSAREKATDAATGELITKLLEKAHKVVVLEAEFHGVENHEHLLKILEYTKKLEGVYHVRQMSFDKKTGTALIEIIASPHTENYWRAHMESWPEVDGANKKKQFKFKTNKKLRAAYENWFVE